MAVFRHCKMDPLNETNVGRSKESIPGAYSCQDERTLTTPPAIVRASRNTPMCVSPLPRTRLFASPTGDLPALCPTIFTSPVKNPVAIIQTIKQIPSQAYTDIPLLDKSQCNWDLWNRKLCIVLEGCGLDDYIYSLLPCPSSLPENVLAWIRNDKLARSFILSHCSDEEQCLIKDIGLAGTAYQFLKLRHECEGAYTQLILIQEAFTLCFACSARFATSFNTVKDLVKCISNIGFPSMDAFLHAVLLNMLQGEFVGLCDQVAMAMLAATSISPYTPNDILKQLELEQQLLNGTVRTADTALLATQKGRHPQSTKLCSNCNHTGHLIATCWREGGGMAGWRDEILAEKAKKCITSSSLPPTWVALSLKSGTCFDNTGQAFILDANGFAVYLANSTPPEFQPAAMTSSHLSDATTLLATFPDEQLADFEVFLASTEDFDANVNWNLCSILGIPPATTALEQSFILDTGATTHISFCHTDFTCLSAIPPPTVFVALVAPTSQLLVSALLTSVLVVMQTWSSITSCMFPTCMFSLSLSLLSAMMATLLPLSTQAPVAFIPVDLFLSPLVRKLGIALFITSTVNPSLRTRLM